MIARDCCKRKAKVSVHAVNIVNPGLQRRKSRFALQVARFKTRKEIGNSNDELFDEFKGRIMGSENTSITIYLLIGSNQSA